MDVWFRFWPRYPEYVCTVQNTNKFFQKTNRKDGLIFFFVKAFKIETIDRELPNVLQKSKL